MLKPKYILACYTSSGERLQEIYNSTWEAWQRYEQLKREYAVLKVEVYTRMMYYPDDREE